MEVSLDILRKENELSDIFCNLASIPSPSLKEEKVIEWILDFCAKNNIQGKWAFTQETNNQQACLYAHYGIQGLGFNFDDKIKETIKTVTPEQIKVCAEKYFNNKSVVSIIRP